MTDMTDMPNVTRRAEVRRETKETTVALSLTVDGSGTTSVWCSGTVTLSLAGQPSTCSKNVQAS